jgi:hypothetical protein
MLDSADNPTAVLCCNTANSSPTINGKFEMLNIRIGSVRNRKLCAFNPALHMYKPLGRIMAEQRETVE